MKLLLKQTKRGSILLLTFFILIFLALLGSGFLILIPVEMRNAHQDRTAVQSAFGADAAVRMAMNDLGSGVVHTAISREPIDMGGGWQYQVENTELLTTDEYRVTTRGLLNGVVKRRAVAIIDNASTANTNALNFTAASPNGFQIINPQGAWPVHVPITGDVFVQGTWNLDRSGTNINNLSGPTIGGRVFHTQPTGSGLRGENNTGGDLTQGEYDLVYKDGSNAIQPYNAPIQEENLLLRDNIRPKLLGSVFGVDGSAADALAAAVTAPFAVPSTSGTMNGGIYVNPATGKGAKGAGTTVRMSVDAQGNSVISVKDLNQTTTFTFITEGGLYGTTTVPDNQDRLYVTTSTAPLGGDFYNGDFSKGNVIYIDGPIDSIEGEHKGNHTIAAADAITITNDILKSDTPRGRAPGPDSTDALGLIACVDAGNSSPGMGINMSTTPIFASPAPPRTIDITGGGNLDPNEYFVYSYVTALSKTDGNAFMFSAPTHPSLPSGRTLTWVGNLTWAPTTPGHINTTMSFIESWKEIIVDPNHPIEFPNLTSNIFVPQIRAYVDLTVGQ